MLYAENFTSNPNFTSLSSTHAFWDDTQGNYYVNTYDNLTYKYWAYSPKFTQYTGQSDLIVEFDMLFEYMDWGTYPGVRFYDNQPTEISNTSISFEIFSAYADYQYREIGIRDKSDPRNQYLTEAAEDDIWYSVKISYFSDLNKANILIKEKSTGNTFFSVDNVNFMIGNFQYLGVGYYDQPDYGNAWSPIRIDNIKISAP